MQSDPNKSHFKRNEEWDKMDLADLPEGLRKVVQMIAVEGLSITEAAGRLDMTPGAVRVALHRGLAALAKQLGQD